MKRLAHSPAALEAYLSFAGALGHGVLDAAFREEIAITMAQANSCEYRLSAHATIGKMTGLSASEIDRSRESHAADPKRDAGLQFAHKTVVQRGEISDHDLAALRGAGYGDAEVTELVAHVALNIFTNYFNLIASTQVDFPRVPLAMVHA
jgi:AhpD family alkylhydroperoxidase